MSKKEEDEKIEVLEMVVRDMLAVPNGRALLDYFITEAMGQTFTTDPIMNGFLEGRRWHGKKMFEILRRKHPELIQATLTGE